MKLATLLAPACALALACSNSPTPGNAPAGQSPQSGPPGKGPDKAQPPALVELATASKNDLADHWTFLGRAEAALAAELAAAAAGHVLTVQVREGDRVTARQTLLTLDSARLQAELAAARAREQGLTTELELAKKQLDRVSKIEASMLSAAERERFELAAAKADAQLAAQKAEIRKLQVELDHHTVRAPFDGVISARHVDPGAWVSVGQKVLGLVSMDDLEIHVDVSPDLGSRLEVGQTARILGPTAVDGKIAGIVQALDTSTRTMRVRLLPGERPKGLMAGMAVDVEFAVTLEGQGVLVPRDAVIRGPVSTRIIKYVDGGAVPIDVTVMATAQDRALVRGDGLVAGDQVVVRGNERLRPGQPLQVAKP